MSVQSSRSEYVDVAKMTNSVTQHVQDILIQRIEATSVSSSNLRFSLKSPGVRSLLDSEVLLVCPMRIRTFDSIGGAMSVLAKEQQYDVNRKAHNYATAVAAGNGGGAQDDSSSAGQLAAKLAISPGAGKCLSFCERISGFWKSVQSVQVEVNSVSYSYSCDEFLHLTDMFLLPKRRQRHWPNGPMDSGSGASECFVGRAFKMPVHTNWLAGAQHCSSGKWEEHELDVGFSKRVKMFRDKVFEGKTAAELLALDGGDFDYEYVTRICIPPFSYYRKNIGSGRRSYIPYVNSLTILINFKSDPEKFNCMFQASCALGNGSNGQGCLQPVQHTDEADTRGRNLVAPALRQFPGGSRCSVQIGGIAAGAGNLKVPTLLCRFVNPPENMALAPSYSFSLPRYVTYMKEATAASMRAAGGHNFRFSAIKMEVAPKFYILSCRPKETNYNVNRLEHLGTGRWDCTFQDTFDCFPTNVKDYDPTSMKIQINEQSGLISTFSLRQLYEMTVKNAPDYPYSFECFKREKTCIIFTNADLPARVQAGIYAPTTFSLSVNFEAGVRHKAISTTSAVNVNGNLLASFGTNAIDRHECSLIFVFEDTLTLANNSASTSAFLISSGSVSKSATGPVRPSLDGMGL